jgi:hypothetical protein
MDTLPAVAKNFYYPCGKCDSERYHKVIAHLSATEAKLECEVCGSKKKFKLGKKKVAKKTTTRRSAKNHEDSWAEMTEKFSNVAPELYSIRGVFPMDTLIDHPTFGIGVVTDSQAHKIEVCFKEGVKTLMHRRDP